MRQTAPLSTEEKAERQRRLDALNAEALRYRETKRKTSAKPKTVKPKTPRGQK